MTHIDGPECPGCDQKLTQAHPYLSEWFKTKVKPKYPNAHISWSYRDEASQAEAFAEGKSKLEYPASAHNHTLARMPYSYALDLFEQVNGKAVWDMGFFNSVAKDCGMESLPIFWGGKWKELGDNDHFQYQELSGLST